MDKATVKKEILEALEADLDTWLDQESQISNGYEYETAYLAFTRKINKVILGKTMGKLPGSHNSKKNYTPVLGK